MGSSSMCFKSFQIAPSVQLHMKLEVNASQAAGGTKKLLIIVRTDSFNKYVNK